MTETATGSARDGDDPGEAGQGAGSSGVRDGSSGVAGDQEASEELTPESAFHRTVEEGRRRMDRGWSALIATGIVGGLDIGTGVLGLLVVESQTHSKLLAGFAFSIGFIALTMASSELFTEDFLVPVSAVVARKSTFAKLVRLWAVTLAANLAGGWVVTALVVHGLPELSGSAAETGRFYAGLGYGWRAFCLALLGGLVITLMTWMQHSIESVGGKLVAAVVAGWLLGAASLNHAIVASLLMFAALHTGHPGFGYLDWAGAAGFAALGNLIGGLGLVTVLRLLQVPHRVALERRNPTY